MEKMKITFLGTSDAIPSKERNHPSFLLSYKTENILIDCGEGTQRQFRTANLNPCKLTRILITHWHGDHILGLPGLFQTLSMLNYNKKLCIYGPRGTEKKISLIKALVNVEIPLEIHEVANEKIIETEEFYIETKEMNHGTPTNGYSFVIKDKKRLDKNKLKKLKIPNSPLIKKLQEGEDIKINNKIIRSSGLSYLEKGKKITFIIDTAINNNAIELAKYSDILISEACFLETEKEQAMERLHLTVKDAATIAKKAKVKSLVLTHISQRYQAKMKEVEQEAKSFFKNSSIAKDLQTIEL